MHQSVKTPAPRPPGLNGEFNIGLVLKRGLFPHFLRQVRFVKSPAWGALVVLSSIATAL